MAACLIQGRAAALDGSQQGGRYTGVALVWSAVGVVATTAHCCLEVWRPAAEGILLLWKTAPAHHIPDLASLALVVRVAGRHALVQSRTWDWVVADSIAAVTLCE